MADFSGMIGGQWFDNIKPETQAYYTRNPDVLKSYQSNNYGKNADQFAQFHYDNFGGGERRVWGALPATTTGGQNPVVTGGNGSATTTGGQNPVVTGGNGSATTTGVGAGQTNNQVDTKGIVGSVLKGLEPILGGSSNKQPATAVTQQVDPSQLTSAQLSKIIAGNSDLNQQAQNKAMQIANSRGMANSAMAAAMGTEALISQALPIAQSNSSMYANQAAANQNALNQFALTNLNGEIQSNLARSNFGYNLGTGIVNDFLQTKRDDSARDFQRETSATSQNYALDRMRADYAQQDKSRLEQNNFAASQQDKQNTFTVGQQDKQNVFAAGQQDRQNVFAAGQQDKQNVFAAAQQDKLLASQLEQLKQNMGLAYDKMTVDQTNTYAAGYLSIVNSNMPLDEKELALSGYSAIYGFHDNLAADTSVDLSGLPVVSGG